jgi:hypothetical protein
MKKKLLKIFLLIIGLLFSPLVVALVAGILFIFVKLIIGSKMSEAIQALKMIINGVIPLLPFITILPVVLFLLAITLKNLERIKKRFKNIDISIYIF